MAKTTLPTDVISIADAARILNVSTRTVRRHISAGRLTGYRIGPRLLRVDRDELATLVRVIPTAGS